ncbi:DUF2059 domain-containing protein [Erythrobacter sp. SCSIO 43205]|uniref:DUF2059 domain-containing protein n=1 Tax=Erythrobacter sp. SCSIO 43205 TaxID=2779361 RepID=UPI001CA9759E|nr:DUF2059 domain-containing protein [Erythrobacter sp. SCSIO 43205]UAB77081.1 DUF2059 domain-containing protein [Erythrobacter sp. SCSIO 43205]
MRKLLVSAFAASLALASSHTPALAQEAGGDALVAEPSAAKLALALEIIDLGFPEETREEIFFASMDQMMVQTREASLKAYGLDDEGAIAVLDQWLADYILESKEVLRSHIPSLMAGMQRSYAAMFTLQELRDIRAFVATPSGQRFFELSSAVLAEPNFANANQAYMDEVQAQMPAAMQDLIGRLQSFLEEKQQTEGQVAS